LEEGAIDMSSYKNVRDEQRAEDSEKAHEEQFRVYDAFSQMGEVSQNMTWGALYKAREDLRARGVPDVHESSKALYAAMKAIRGPAQPLGGVDDIVLGGEKAADRREYNHGLANNATVVRSDFTDQELDIAQDVLRSIAVHASAGRLPSVLQDCPKADQDNACGLDDNNDLIFAMARYFIDEIDANRGRINRTLRDAVTLSGQRA
jgi:hypothetical protein